MLYPKRVAGISLLSVLLLCLSACANVAASNKNVVASGTLSYASTSKQALGAYPLAGQTLPVLDPSIIRQGSTWYAYSTDVVGFQSSSSLPIHCSRDKVTWKDCGYVFPKGIPAWIKNEVPGVVGLWAPDISYFNGEYRLYYNGSVLNTNLTVIGMATNRTLDPKDPSYEWVDRGLVLESRASDDFNALDPNIFIDTDGSVWMTYGSYWTGIKQRQIDAATGMLLASNPTRYDLATRPGVPDDAIEGASLVRHGKYYYLFVSVDHCCTPTTAQDDYKQAVGRSTSPHGPFVDTAGTPMMNGGGTVLMEGNANWNAPGGGSAYLDNESGDTLLVFHAQNLGNGGIPYAWVKKLGWRNDWPIISN